MVEIFYKISPYPNSAYTVGWICALPLEMAAAGTMLDEYHGISRGLSREDTNSYRLGSIGSHNVAVACLRAGEYGTVSAAIVASNMRHSFRSLKIRLMVGIGGGVPGGICDIRLGDVVVSRPGRHSGGVIKYDHGKALSCGEFIRTGSLDKPPEGLLAATASLEAWHEIEGNQISTFIDNMRDAKKNFQYPGTGDVLFESDYNHVDEKMSCDACSREKELKRPDRKSTLPEVHYGLIASGDKVMRDGRTRDQLREQLDVLCFEMEAAGLMDSFKCLVIRGICDYSDSHKNKKWQRYAAATAAAYAKELLHSLPSDLDRLSEPQPGSADTGATARKPEAYTTKGTPDIPPSYDQAVKSRGSEPNSPQPLPASSRLNRKHPAVLKEKKGEATPAGMLITIPLKNARNDAVRDKVKAAYPNGMLGYVSISEVDALNEDALVTLDYFLHSIKDGHNFENRLDTSKHFRLNFEKKVACHFSDYPIGVAGSGSHRHRGGQSNYLAQIARDTGKTLEDARWELGGLGMWAVETYFALCRYRGILSFNDFKWRT